MKYWNLLCIFYITILVFVSVYYYFKRKVGQNSSSTSDLPSVSKLKLGGMDQKTEYIILGMILIFGFFLRFYQFGAVPMGINQDGAMAAVDAKALADYGTDRFGMKFPIHFTAWGYGQMSVLLSYLMIPFIKIGGLSVITARMPMLILSMVSLIIVYFFVKDLTDSKKALLVTAFLTINPWHIMQSRWALDCNVFPHMFLIGLFLLYKGIKNYEKERFRETSLPLFGSMFFFAMCMYSYGISFYTVPVFLIIMCVYLLRKKLLTWKKAILSVFVYFFFSWPIYFVMAINTLKLPTIATPFFTIPFFPDSVRSNDILFFSSEPFKQFMENAKSLFNIVIKQGKDLPWNAIDGMGILYLCTLPLVILGFVYAILKIIKSKEKIEKAGYVSLLVFLLIGVLAGLITSNVNINRVNIIIYPLIILAGLGIGFVVQWGKKWSYTMILPYSVLFVLFITTYFSSYANHMKYYFFGGFDEALYYAQDYDCDTYYITPDVQYEGSKNVSEILTLFCHDIDARYFQGKTSVLNKEVTSPYAEKYQYTRPDSIEINPNNPVVYVINSKDLSYFNNNEYHIEYFDGGFCVVVPLFLVAS